LTLPPDRFTGVLAAALTPLDTSLRPNHNLMAAHSRWLLDNGCDGLAILGTTGEANSFSLPERIEIIESLVDNGIPGEKLLPGTGSCAVTDAVELTRKALDAGARGVLMLPPFYYKNPSDEGLHAFFSEVIQKVGDECLKIYLYHFPRMSATPITHGLIEMLRRDYPETVVGVKDSSGDLDNMLSLARNFPGFCVLAGADDLLLPVLQGGGGGCITACANVGSKLAADVYAGHLAGRNVDDAQARLVAVRREISAFPLPPALKTLMARHTGNDEWLNVRPPLTRLSEEQKASLLAAFDGIDYEIPAAA